MIPNAHRMFNFDLGETADAIRETVHAFSSNEIAPRAAEIDKSNQFPRDLWPKIGALGLHGITVEEEYGGSGLGYLEHCIAVEEMSRASAAVGLSYGAHSNLCVNQLRRELYYIGFFAYWGRIRGGRLHTSDAFAAVRLLPSDASRSSLRTLGNNRARRYHVGNTRRWMV